MAYSSQDASKYVPQTNFYPGNVQNVRPGTPIKTRQNPKVNPNPNPNPNPDPIPDPIPDPDPVPTPAEIFLPEYAYDVNINVPNFAWSPTAEQRTAYSTSGANRANTVIDPQVSAVLQALTRFKTEATNQQNEINPRYTDMSLALANVIKNQVYQPGVDELIRRGAADSGALRQLQESAGRYETEQRAAVEQERNQILNALANQVLAKEQETTDAQTALEKLRGQYTDVYTGEEEQKAYEQFMNEKQSKFNADLSVAQLQNQVAAAIAQQQYQNALLSAQQQQSAFENSMAEKEFALQQALQNYNMSRSNVSSTPTTPTQTITVSTPYGNIPLTVQQAISAGYLSNNTNKSQSLADYLFGNG